MGAIMVWSFIVLREIWSAMQFAFALSALPRGVTHVNKVRERDEYHGHMILISISSTRYLFMMLVTSVRVAVALALLVFGAKMLAYTAELMEIILNVVALSFVMECDELIFANFAPLSIKALVRSMAPLPRQHRVFHGVDAMPVLNVLFIIVVFAVVWQFYVTPSMAVMRVVQHTLCGGDQDFVLGVQHATGMILSTATVAFRNSVGSERGKSRSNWAVAANELAARSEPTMSVFHQNRRVMETQLAQTMTEIAGNTLGCEDWDFSAAAAAGFLNESLTPFLLTLQNFTGDDGAKSCEDFNMSCTAEDAALLRRVCPVVCGCGDPLSGLLLSGPRFGCPRDECRESPGWLAALATLECEDFSLEALQELGGWRSFIEQLRGIKAEALWESAWDPEMRALNANMTGALERSGCSALAGREHMQISLCNPDHQSITSLHAFCPRSCGCNEAAHKGCPLQCHKTSREVT